MPHVPGTSIASPSQPDGTSQHRPVEVAASTRQTSLLHYFKPLAKTVADEAETRASVPVEVASSPCSMALDIASTPTATPQAERVSTHYKLWVGGCSSGYRVHSRSLTFAI